MAGPVGSGPELSGRRIVITRAASGELGERLVAAGAEVIHLPLIAAIDPVDGGEAARAAVAGVQPGDWLVVTSPEGARRALAAGPVAPTVRTAAVGEATARVLATGLGREVDLVPVVALGRELGHELGDLLEAARAARAQPATVLVLHGDLASQDWVDDLRARGHRVRTLVAYRTVATEVDPAVGHAAARADAVVFASGSAVRAWVASIGVDAPEVICAIGPSTTAAAASVGLRVTHQALQPSVAGIVDILRSAFRDATPTMG